jgi:hypothetical protein
MDLAEEALRRLDLDEEHSSVAALR